MGARGGEFGEELLERGGRGGVFGGGGAEVDGGVAAPAETVVGGRRVVVFD